MAFLFIVCQEITEDTCFTLFPEFLYPFINYFYEQCTESFKQCQYIEQNLIIEQLSHYLLEKLSQLCIRTIAADIKQKSSLGLLKGDTPEERYTYYVHDLLGSPEGLFTLIQRYPVLGRLWVTLTDQIINNSLEWVKRLTEDYITLTQNFGKGAGLGIVVETNPRLSDPHSGGRTVWYVKFSSGASLAYKQRSFGLDYAYNKFLKWLNSVQPDLDLKSAQLIDRTQYGWVEWIVSKDCKDNTQIQNYFKRQGAHLCVFYFLGGTDFHEENFIQAGEYPIPIDLEGLCSVALSFENGWNDPIRKLPRPWHKDVLYSTHMLPRWYSSGDYEREAIAMSGIMGRNRDQDFPIPVPVWYGVGTDKLQMKFEYRKPLPSSSVPTINGKLVDAKDYLDSVLEGFNRTYTTFLQNCDILAQDDSPLSDFQNLATRVLIRDTESYARVLFWSTAPDHLISGSAYDVSLEVVCGTPIIDEKRSDAYKYGVCEKRDLWSRDIPYFQGSTTQSILYASDGSVFGPINDFCGWTYIQSRLINANEEDLAWQKELLRVSWEMYYTPSGSQIVITESNSFNKQINKPSDLDSKLFNRILQHLELLGLQLEKQAAQHNYGISWLSLGKTETSKMPLLGHPVPWSLVGAAGITIFLANLAAYTQNSEWSALAKKAVVSTYGMTSRFYQVFDLHKSGLCFGLSATIYALIICAQRLNEPSFINLANELLMSIPTKEWSTASSPDVLSGSAATLLVLIALFEKNQNEQILIRAISQADAILQHQIKFGQYAGGFKLPNSRRPVLGMAHGAAGIAYSLSKLHDITHDTKLYQSIDEAISFENSFFSSEHKDWPSLWHDPNQPLVFMSGWCGGAPGIGLARLGMPDQFNHALMPDIEAACQATLRHLGTGGHHLCCGEAGRIIFLVTASQQLNRPELFQAAAEATNRMLDFYEQRGYWKLQTTATRSIIPGLIDGVAGIGLSLLTLIDPKQTSRFLTLS